MYNLHIFLIRNIINNYLSLFCFLQLTALEMCLQESKVPFLNTVVTLKRAISCIIRETRSWHQQSTIWFVKISSYGRRIDLDLRSGPKTAHELCCAPSLCYSAVITLFSTNKITKKIHFSHFLCHHKMTSILRGHVFRENLQFLVKDKSQSASPMAATQCFLQFIFICPKQA